MVHHAPEPREPRGGLMLEDLHAFVEHLASTDVGRGLAKAFDGAIQLRWVPGRIDPKDTAWFGTDDGSWACLEFSDGEISVVDGDRRSHHDWRSCVLIETDEETLGGILAARVRPLD